MSKGAFELANKIRIGLKYCGGCKPEYDRVQAVVLIRERLQEEIELVSHEEPDTHGTLVVAGCPTACVDLTPFAGRPVWVVTSLSDVEEFVQRTRLSPSWIKSFSQEVEMRPTCKASEIETGYHPSGFRIDKTGAPLDRYTQWEIDAKGRWHSAKPVCFHTLPEQGWMKDDPAADKR